LDDTTAQDSAAKFFCMPTHTLKFSNLIRLGPPILPCAAKILWRALPRVSAATQLGNNSSSIITGAIIPQPVSTLTLSLLLILSADDGTEAQLRSILEPFNAHVVPR
jgi:hypothetical protein